MEALLAVDTAVVVALVALVQAVGVAVINGLLNRRERSNEAYREKRERAEAELAKEQKERDDYRKELDVSLLGLAFASAEGTEVLLHQAHGEQVNGNVDAALDSIKRAKGRCNEIVNKKAMS